MYKDNPTIQATYLTSMKRISYQISTSYNELYLFNSGISGGGRERKRERERKRKREKAREKVREKVREKRKGKRERKRERKRKRK